MKDQQQKFVTSDVLSSGNFHYRLQAGVLLQLLRESEAIVRFRKPIGTKIIQVEPCVNGIAVRENYYQFPRGQSNLYFLDYTFQLIWSAELPSSHDVYANPVFDRGDYLECATWECFTCRICPKTGKILSKQFTK